MKPVVILIRPQMGENIGAVARAMGNFGLSELRLVAPRDGWPNPAATAMASGAIDILDNAKLYATIDEALADIHHAYATTARPRELNKRVITPSEMVAEINLTKKVALVFGPERTGLENDDLSLCNTIVTIPTSSEYSSLNLAQSVVVVGYEYAKVHLAPAPGESLPPAPLSQYAHLFSQLEVALGRGDFFKAAEKKPIMMQNIKTMLLRAQWSEQELRTFYGMVKAMTGE